MKFAVVIYSNDAETVWNALRFANTCLAYDNEVYVFLLGKGVEAKTVSTITYDIDEQLEIFDEQGGNLIGCGVCCESRKDEMPNLEMDLSCEIGSMQTFYSMVVDADKVLTF